MSRRGVSCLLIFLQRLLGNNNAKEIKKMRAIADHINEIEPNYVKLSDELGNEITLDGCKIINIKDATTANADWADMGYDLSPYLIGDSDIETKFINIQKNI